MQLFNLLSAQGHCAPSVTCQVIQERDNYGSSLPWLSRWATLQAATTGVPWILGEKTIGKYHWQSGCSRRARQNVALQKGQQQTQICKAAACKNRGEGFIRYYTWLWGHRSIFSAQNLQQICRALSKRKRHFCTASNSKTHKYCTGTVILIYK